jgi:excisionase family DNA binding protein
MNKTFAAASPRSTSGPLLSISAVAKRLDVSTRTVRRLIDDKSIAIHRIGRQIRISEADLAAYVQSQREP